MKANALNAPKLDWAAISAELHRKVDGKPDAQSTWPAIIDLLMALGDGHSFMQVDQARRDDFKARYGYEFDRALATRPAAVSSFMDRREVEVERVSLGSALAQYLRVPMFIGGGARGSAFAQQLFDAQKDARSWACGYVVDLRGNGGGTSWPMLAGLSPLLGDGKVYGDVGASGQPSWAVLGEGRAEYHEAGGEPVVAAQVGQWSKLEGLDRAPVALILDGATASSAEGLAIAFRERPNTRSFGARSHGASTANAGSQLSDGANLVITVAVMIDRNATPYPQGVAVDQAADPALKDGGDAARKAAQAWLAEQPGCRATR